MVGTAVAIAGNHTHKHTYPPAHWELTGTDRTGDWLLGAGYPPDGPDW